MLAKVTSCAVLGLDAVLIDVEVDSRNGLPGVAIVGLPDSAVRESRDRVQAAIRNCGLHFPFNRVTINLAPADLRKEGPAYDLPIAIGVLAASGQIPQDVLNGGLFIGELSLDGTVRHVRGVLSVALLARELDIERVYVPLEDAPEAALIPGLEVIPVDHLISLTEHLLGLDVIPPFDHEGHQFTSEVSDEGPDFGDIKGQEHVRRALEVAAAGGHNILMMGPPGTGKTLMARALPSILPQMTLEEALEVTRIYSVADLLPRDMPMLRERPFRAPHHTISHAGLVGGGQWPRPGEVSLAHRGVLFLDEMPEFGNRNLETLRQPIEDRHLTVSRASGAFTFPANFILAGAMNPCPCGYHGDPVRECTCAQGMIMRYRGKLSGPLMDRIDIHIEVPRVEYEKLAERGRSESSESVRARVQAARDRQLARFAESGLACNADMGPGEVRTFVEMTDDAQALMKNAMQQMQLSARAFHRLQKLARTIADLGGAEGVEAMHLAEAIQYRAR